MVHRKAEGLKKAGMTLILIGILIGGLGAGPSDRANAAPDAPQAGTLHNPGFDNHIWYEFNNRYGNWFAGSWVPDDDTAGGPQDWRLWYMRGKPLPKAFAENGIIQSVESVVLRTYDGNIQEGGLYQMVYDVTPGLHYTFQMYALTRPDDDVSDKTAVLKVGIDPTGWAPDASSDPAFPGYYPASIVWGETHDYKYPNFGALSVTAEARANKITVFTYGYMYGGPKHAVVWESGSLVDVTPAMIQPVDSLPAPSGIYNLATATGSNSAQISWTTLAPAISQVYYRQVPQQSNPNPYPPTIYLPYVTSNTVPQNWMHSPLNKTASTSHTVLLSGLTFGGTYDFIVVSRGLDNGQCVTWVSNIQQITLQ
ncbi:MAG: hypothetical protein JXA21_08705 [Anaerolineae bacterium]|nr:hypothetical protein [Anaerolineae bacterium]